ncbi:MAG: hypothetical protein ACRDPJ_19680 [Nocardioidaceae bacterium]
MATWGPDGIGDVLEQGDDLPRRPHLRSAGLAVLLLGAGALAGYQAQESASHPAPAGRRGPVLVAGMVEKDTRLTSGSFVLPLHNGTRKVVKILDVDLEGWASVAHAVSIPPGSWGTVQLDLTVNCRSTPYATRDIIVRATAGGGEFAEVLPMPGLPSDLNEEVSRRCSVPTGSVPARKELLGTWLVERAHQFAGEMLIRLNRDGTFAMDPENQLFTDPGARGTFTLHGDWVALHTRGGSDCEAGDEAIWRVSLLESGELRIRHMTYYDGWCRIEAGEVWIAKRVSEGPPGSRPTAPDSQATVPGSGQGTGGSRWESLDHPQSAPTWYPDTVPVVPGVQP